MILTAEQTLRIAVLYEQAAADRLGVPPQQRTAFARKAKWFRMKAGIRAKKEAVCALAEQGTTARPDEVCVAEARPDSHNDALLDRALLNEAGLDEADLDEAWLQQAGVTGTASGSNGNGARPNEPRLNEARPDKARRGEARVKKSPKRYQSIAERIAAARAAAQS
jgi:hypothetical protein